MNKSLFDLSPEQTASTAMPRTVVFSNGTGSGSMTICPLFSGAELYYNDMHLVSFDETPALARNVIEINHCRVGRYECSFGENSCCYLAAGDFAVVVPQRKAGGRLFARRCTDGKVPCRQIAAAIFPKTALVTPHAAVVDLDHIPR